MEFTPPHVHASLRNLHCHSNSKKTVQPTAEPQNHPLTAIHSPDAHRVKVVRADCDTRDALWVSVLLSNILPLV